MSSHIKILFLLLHLQFLFSQSSSIRFDHISVEQGLSQSTVNCILQDSQGYLWFGSELGLKKFDGYKFTDYQHDPNNPGSLSNSEVRSITENKSGSLWIGTKGGGLNRFDRELEIFIHYGIIDSNSQQKEPIHILTTLEDQSGNLWIGTSNNGLYYFDRKMKSFKRYSRGPSNNTGPSSNYIGTLYEDREGAIWIGTGYGLNKFDREKELFTHYKYDPEVDYSLSNNRVWSIAEDKSGNLFIATRNGLNKFDRKKNGFIRYLYEPVKAKRASQNLMRVLCPTKSGLIWIGIGIGLIIFNPDTEEFVNLYQKSDLYDNLKNKAITAVYEDRSGIIWIGIISGDIFKYDPNKIKFIHYKSSPNNPHSLSHDHILGLYEDSQGTLWVGTWGGGLNELRANQVNNPSPRWINHKHNPLNPKSINNNSVFDIYEDSEGSLWIGTWGGGLNKLVHPKVNLTNAKNPKDMPSSTHYINGSANSSSNTISCIYEDKHNNLWLGTYRGLYKFDRSTESFTHYAGDPENSESLGTNDIWCIFQSRNGQMWIGTGESGLYNFDPAAESFTRYHHDPENPNSLSSNTVFMIYEDGSGFLWMTTTKGLNKFDPGTGDFKHYTSNVGLPDDATYAILADSKGNFWISSGKGMFRFSPESGMVKSFTTDDGLQSMDFNPWGHKSKRGWMYFSGVNGFNAFHPDSIKYNGHIPKVVLTDLQIFNKSILPGSDSPLKKTISEAKEIVLTHNQSVFSFEFAALDYRSPQKNQYAYQMEGVDPDWVYTDASRRFATYTNLDAGEYTFRVKGSNNDGIWNEKGTSIKITITPPWWKTNLAYAFYLLFIGMIIFVLWRFQTNRLKIKHELELEHVHAEKLEEVDRLKSHFFANISHEFRTPLTLILGPVEQMFSGAFKGNYKEQYKVIIRNAGRLLQLINQLLDLSKLESGKLKLHAERNEIVRVTNRLVQAFESLAERKSIDLIFQSEIESQEVYIDLEKFETIINNLLSNAFKYTPDSGTVEILISPIKKLDNRDCVQIKITNTGKGVPSDQIDHIFDRFYQIDDSYKKDQEGTGIGLALTKELVELHHGEIRVESEPDIKTTFTILLPLGKKHLKKDEIALIIQDYSTPEMGTSRLSKSVEDTAEPGVRKKSFEAEISIHENLPTILIVEDNADLRQYICSVMENDYQIIEAENGNEALAKSTEQIPDLIISDVMMPEMDGFEFCTAIKTDERTSHIPVILLTARAAMEDKIEGLETGADDYITKPFDNKELNVRVKNLIEQRRKLHERFRKVSTLEPSEIAVTSIDKQFLIRALEIIEKEISNPEFDVETFVKEMAVSRTLLYNKIRALAGQSVKEFIRTIRLKRGAQLIRKQAGSITEIAYDVGFLNPAYFSECFRKQFDQTPSQYASQLKD